MAIGFSLLLTITGVKAQQSNSGLQSIAPYRMEIGYSKTSNIIFPQAIISVDRGSKDVLARKAKGVENILQVKAARDSFPETNISVVTADGRLNSFIINYSSQPAALNLSVPEGKAQNGNLLLSAEKPNQAEVQKYAKAAAGLPENVRGVKDRNFGIRFTMEGLSIHNDVLYFRIRIENRSNIKYDIDQLRFFIRDQRKAKRTAIQEIEVTPLYTQNNVAAIEGQSDRFIVFAVTKFTIPDKKYLAIQLMEKNGGRHLELHVKNSLLIRAQPLAF